MPTDTSTDLCAHCGEPSPAGATYCCRGCATVAAFLTSQGDRLESVLRDRLVGHSQQQTNDTRFDHLDDLVTRERYTTPEDRNTMRFHVDGLHCSACLTLIERLPDIVPGVATARLQFSQACVTLGLAPEGTFGPAVRALDRLGYTLHPLTPEDDGSRHRRRESRRHLMRLGLTGFCAGNIMLLSIALYAGAEGRFQTTFNWVSFALFIPVLTWCAQPFYHSVASAWKQRRATVDLPVVVALWAGTAVSLQRLLSGAADTYVDSLAILVFLLLAARQILLSLQRRGLARTRLNDWLGDAPAHLLSGDTTDNVDPTTLKAGDRIEVRPGERLPADGRLLTPATLNLSALTGESRPQSLAQGEDVFAGTQCESASLQLEITATGSHSRLGHLLDQVVDLQTVGTPLVTLADRAAQYFTAFVVGLAVLTAAGLFGPQGLERALALVIVACPCALAFGAPLAFAFTMRRLARRGILVKSAASLEQLADARHAVFDKTGTLTTGNYGVTHWDPAPLPETLSIIATLEASSRHPIARALRDACGDAPIDKHIEVTETPGQGVSSTRQGQQYILKGLDDDRHPGTAIGLFIDGQLTQTVWFDDPVRDDSPAIVRHLTEAGLIPHLISGDGAAASQAVAAQVGISPDHTSWRQSPENKTTYLGKHTHTLMIGDGLNDAPALAHATVGIAVAGSLEASLEAADVTLTQPGLQGVTDLVRAGRETRALLRRNLVVSLLYNSLFGALALAGWVTPLVAAILMPLSSLTVFASAAAGTRRLRRWN